MGRIRYYRFQRWSWFYQPCYGRYRCILGIGPFVIEIER